MQHEMNNFPHDKTSQEEGFHEHKLIDMDLIAVEAYKAAQGLEVIGSSKGLYMNTRFKRETYPECFFRVDTCEHNEKQESSSSNEECEITVLEETVSFS